MTVLIVSLKEMGILEEPGMLSAVLLDRTVRARGRKQGEEKKEKKKKRKGNEAKEENQELIIKQQATVKTGVVVTSKIAQNRQGCKQADLTAMGGMFL